MARNPPLRFAFSLGASGAEDLIAEVPYPNADDGPDERKAQLGVERELTKRFKRELSRIEKPDPRVQGGQGSASGFSKLLHKARGALLPYGALRFHGRDEELGARALAMMHLNGHHFKPVGADARHGRLLPRRGASLEELACALHRAVQSLGGESALTECLKSHGYDWKTAFAQTRSELEARELRETLLCAPIDTGSISGNPPSPRKPRL